MVPGVANSRTMKSDNEARMHALIQLSPSPLHTNFIASSPASSSPYLLPTYSPSFFHSLLKHSFYCFTLTIRSPPHQPPAPTPAYTQTSPVLQPSPSRELFLFKDQTEVYRDLTPYCCLRENTPQSSLINIVS